MPVNEGTNKGGPTETTISFLMKFIKRNKYFIANTEWYNMVIILYIPLKTSYILYKYWYRIILNIYNSFIQWDKWSRDFLKIQHSSFIPAYSLSVSLLSLFLHLLGIVLSSIPFTKPACRSRFSLITIALPYLYTQRIRRQ